MRHTRGTQVRARGGARRALVGGFATAALLLTAACGQGEEPAAEPEADGGTEAAAEGPAEIRFVWWGNEERAALTNEAVDAFMAANPDITVETESVDFNSYFDRLATAVAAGDEPDVITMGGAYPREYGDRGVLMDLEEVSEHLDLSTLDASALANGYFSDTQYGVPTGVNTFGLIVNPAVFEAAGVELPDDETWDWDEFVDIATEISANTPEGTYGVEDPTAPDALDLYANQHTGLGLYSPEGEIAIEAETVQNWFDMTTTLMEQGATPQASITAELAGQPAPEQTLLGRGLAGMKFGWSNLLSAYSTAAGQDMIMLLPPGESNHEGPGMWLQASQLWTISKNTEYPEASAKLLDFMVNSTEVADILGANRGIPANAEIREHLSTGLTPVQQTEYDFIERVGGHADGDFVVGPTGSTESVQILTRLNDQVLFGQLEPAAAAEQFVTELTAAVS
ncbi:extracellular solute-binding protein [Cellulomonas sp. ATA003]|uniref:ABC transporter substrate-binding protein n=1 Tax=Cellulomonas sp. ATA003 TaxID=3073064 RepID=UPI0028730F99|nr:extracellular solute-binding protein [Cellulomonas sp. ATA003]WNB87152.1 extracellular solute-binding protein [Cellulomonas sp. ATA003]